MDAKKEIEKESVVIRNKTMDNNLKVYGKPNPDRMPDQKLNLYMGFIRDRLGTCRQMTMHDKVIELYSEHVKLKGKAREIIKERIN